MPSFRFCRPDDISLLVEATKQAFDIHFPDRPPMTEELFKHEIRELNLWSSSCMLASEEDRPIGVLIAAKRERASLILRLGVATEFHGRGYGSQLVTSLKDKMRVLGPGILAVEIPEERSDLRTFFEKQGFERQEEYCDFCLDAENPDPELPELVTEIETNAIEDRLLYDCEGETVGNDGRLAWARQTQTIANLKKSIKGLAVPDLDGFAAYLFYRVVQDQESNVDESYIEIPAIGCREKEKAPILCGLLIRTLSSLTGSRIVVPKLSPLEVRFEILEELGFVRGGRTLRYRVETR